MSGGELDFASSEPALGADGKGDGEEPRQHARSRRGISTGRQNKFDASRNSLKAGFKRGNCPIEGHDIAAALFSRRAGNDVTIVRAVAGNDAGLKTRQLNSSPRTRD